MSKVKPISPSEVSDKKLNQLPDEVIRAFNELIAENYCNQSYIVHKGTSIVHQSDVVARIQALTGASESEIFEKHWLDVEDIYRKEGVVCEI